jgi:chromosome segregation ATPase
VVITLAAGFGAVLFFARSAWRRELDDASGSLEQLQSAQDQLLAQLEEARSASEHVSGDASRSAQALEAGEAAVAALKAENERLTSELEAAQVEAVEAEEKRQEAQAQLDMQRRHDETKAHTERNELDERARKLAIAQQEAADLRKALAQAQAGTKKQAELSAEAARAKQALAEAAQAKQALADAARAKQDAAALQAKVTALQAELAAALSAPKAPEKTAAPEGVIAALEADSKLNRGQRETIRMMYDQFTRAVSKR